MLGHRTHGLQCIQALTALSALFCQGNVLLHRGLDPKELAHLIESSAEARRRGNTAEPAYGIVALLDPTMVLLQEIVEIVIS